MSIISNDKAMTTDKKLFLEGIKKYIFMKTDAYWVFLHEITMLLQAYFLH